MSEGRGGFAALRIPHAVLLALLLFHQKNNRQQPIFHTLLKYLDSFYSSQATAREPTARESVARQPTLAAYIFYLINLVP